MTMKIFLPAAVLSLLVAFSASQVLAQPKGNSAPPPQQAMDMNFTAEEQKAFDELWKAHAAKVAPIKEQLWEKSMEYDALSGTANINKDELQVLIKDMSKLQSQLDEAYAGFGAQLETKNLYNAGMYHRGGYCGWSGNGYDHDGRGYYHRGGNGNYDDGRGYHRGGRGNYDGGRGYHHGNKRHGGHYQR